MASDFMDYLKELLSPLGSVRSKRMFGGEGIYINDVFCAIVVDEVLYFKGDHDNAAEFGAAGCPAFTYQREGVEYSMGYYRVPDEAMDNSSEMARWAKLGLAAALRKATDPKKSGVKAARSSGGKKPRPSRL
jgi:DNA transformation protein